MIRIDEAQLGRFGDRRLAATDLLGAMQKRRTMCRHVLGESRQQTRRFSDFLDNEAVSRGEMLVRAGQLTGQRAAGRHALAVADTTELNVANHTASKRGFGTPGTSPGACFARRPENVHLLVRAAQDRSVGGGRKLFGTCASWSAAASDTITVPARRGGSGQGPQPERTALVAVRFGEVTVTRPATAGKRLPAQLTLRVVDVREVDPSVDPKQRVHWCPLTTHAVSSPAEAIGVVRWYRLRWTIEPVFRTLTTDGVAVETSRITTPNTLLKRVTVGLIAAIRVMQLAMGGDGSTQQPLSDAAGDPAEVAALRAINDAQQGNTEKLKTPFDPDSLAWHARMGGWSGYTSKGYRPAGPKTMARGLKRLDAMVAGWTLWNRSALTGLP